MTSWALHRQPCRAAMPCPRNFKAICCDDLTGCGVTLCNFIVHGTVCYGLHDFNKSIKFFGAERMRLPFLFYIYIHVPILHLYTYLLLVPGYLNTHLSPFTQPAAVVHTCNKNLCFTHHCLFLFTFFRCITVAFPRNVFPPKFGINTWTLHYQVSKNKKITMFRGNVSLAT